MQGVTVTWVGKSFALPRCSASSESKPRTRRTKEERRTMVMSFIKKYQSSNDGKFPSLNLTHKEVGGSFYIVREIVRDIIQENKVLGPGNPSSKLLNLEYYSEEEEDVGSFLNVHKTISVAATVSEINEGHHEVVSSMEEQLISSLKNIAIIKPVTQALLNSLNDDASSQVMQDGLKVDESFSCGTGLHEDVVKSGSKESNVDVPTEKEDGFGCVHQIRADVRCSEDTRIQNAKHLLPLYPTLFETSFDETELKSEDTYSISGTSCTESLPVTNLFFSDILDDQKNFLSKNDKDKVFQLAPATFDQDSSSETSDKSDSNTSKISSSGHKLHSSSEPFEDGIIIKSSELESASIICTNSILSTSETLGDSRKGALPFIPLDKDHIRSVQTRETAPFTERNVYAKEDGNVDNLVLQTINLDEPGDTEIDMSLVDKSSSFVVAIEESENVSSKFLKPIIHEAGQAEIMVEKRSFASDAVNDEISMSLSNKEATKESEIQEPNPVWAAIKSFVSSFIKFWSE